MLQDIYEGFKDGCTSIDSDRRFGRRTTAKTSDNIERVRLALDEDRRLSVQDLEHDLKIEESSVWRSLTEDSWCVCEINSKIIEGRAEKRTR